MTAQSFQQDLPQPLNYLWIRNILFYAGIVPVTVILTFSGWLLFFMPFSVRYWIISRWSHFFIFWVGLTCGLKYKVTGKAHIPKENAIVFCNHESMWETIFFQVLLPPQSWILKKELLRIPVFGWGLALIEPIAIDRRQSHSIKTLLKQGKKRLDQGRWVIIFPEGTRVPHGETKAFTRSGASLAHSSQYPVLPVVHNAGLFWPKGFFIRKSGTIQVIIGPLIETRDKSAAEINELAENWMRNTQREIFKI